MQAGPKKTNILLVFLGPFLFESANLNKLSLKKEKRITNELS